MLRLAVLGVGVFVWGVFWGVVSAIGWASWGEWHSQL